MTPTTTPPSGSTVSETNDANGTLIATETTVVCLDRRTAEAEDCVVGSVDGERVEVRGLTVRFPADTGRRDYDLWDTTVEGVVPRPLRGCRAPRRPAGVPLRAGGPRAGDQVGPRARRPGRRPPRTSSRPRSCTAARRRCSSSRSAASSCPPRPARRPTLRAPDGTPGAVLLSGTFRSTADAVDDAVDRARDIADDRGGLQTVVRWTAAALGVALLALGALLVLRSRPAPDPARPTPPRPTPPRTSPSGFPSRAPDGRARSTWRRWSTGTPAAPTPADPESPGSARAAGAVGAALRARWQLRLVCAGFLVLSLLQAPGKILGDTKSDLVVDPLAFLGRALTLWEPEGAAGQIQNQAYGYLFPMGPFFALGQLAGLPAWIVQRLWFAALMSVAFLGVVLLARRLRIGTPATARWSPASPTRCRRAWSPSSAPSRSRPSRWRWRPGSSSRSSGRRSAARARRAAALSGLAVFCVGGVNAVATAAVLPLAALYLLTRPAGPVKRRLIVWWLIAVALATAWWAGPLVLLGRFGPPFLYYIETAAATTGPTDVLSVLRGTSHWLATLASPSGPELARRAGRWCTRCSPIAGTVVLAAAGVAALCRRDLPERTWLVLGLLAGVGPGLAGPPRRRPGPVRRPAARRARRSAGPAPERAQVGPGASACRWCWRLAHLAGVGGAVAAAVARRTARCRRPAAARGRARPRGGCCSSLAVALVASISPALAREARAARRVLRRPGLLAGDGRLPRRRAAQRAGAAGPRVVLPGSTSGARPSTSRCRPLAESPWDVRNAIPLTPEGHIRMLDAIEARLRGGRGVGGPGAVPGPRRDLAPRPAQRPRHRCRGGDPVGAGAPGAARVPGHHAAWPPSGRYRGARRRSDGSVVDAGLVEPDAGDRGLRGRRPRPRGVDRAAVVGGHRARRARGRPAAGGPRPGHRPAHPDGRHPGRPGGAGDGQRRADPPRAQLRPAARMRPPAG